MPFNEISNLNAVYDKENQPARLDLLVRSKVNFAGGDAKRVHHDELKELEKAEPLLKENPRRFVILPIQYHAIWKMYKKAEASFGLQKKLI